MASELEMDLAERGIIFAKGESDLPFVDQNGDPAAPPELWPKKLKQNK